MHLLEKKGNFKTNRLNYITGMVIDPTNTKLALYATSHTGGQPSQGSASSNGLLIKTNRLK